MKIKTETPLDYVLTRIAQWSLLITIVISAISLLGWASGVTFITTLGSYYVPIAPSTALCFLILSVSLFCCLLYPESPRQRMIAGLSALLIILISSIILVAYVAGITFTMERLWFYPPPTVLPFPVGHMSPITAICFIAASLSVLLLTFLASAGQPYKNAASFLAMALITVAFIMFLGYLYGTPLLYGGTIIPVAFPTAVAFMFLGLGLISASGRQVPPVSVLSGPSVRSRLLRAFLPTIIVFVLIYGLIYKAVLFEARNPALASSIIAILSALFVGIIISKLAKSIGSEIDRANIEREKKEVELRQSEETLRESEEKFRLLAHSAQDAIIMIDHEGTISFWNEAAEKIFGYSSQEATGKNCHALIVPPRYHEAYKEGFAEFVKTGLGGAIGKTLELEALRKDGTGFPVELSLSAARLRGKWAAVGIVRDISRRKQNEEKIRILAITDQLTGLYNRRGLLALAEQQLKMAERTQKGLILLFADLDAMKQINDTLGHDAGDEALVEAAQVLQEVFRKMDIIARVGGDEFAVLVPETSKEFIGIVERRLRDQLALHNARTGRAFSLSLSVGMAYCDSEQTCSLDELLTRADSLMYEQKRAKHADTYRH